MATALHVFWRKGIFYWRRRLPPLMATILQTTHLCRSLRTTDRRVAIRHGEAKRVDSRSYVRQATAKWTIPKRPQITLRPNASRKVRLGQSVPASIENARRQVHNSFKHNLLEPIDLSIENCPERQR